MPIPHQERLFALSKKGSHLGHAAAFPTTNGGIVDETAARQLNRTVLR